MLEAVAEKHIGGACDEKQNNDSNKDKVIHIDPSRRDFIRWRTGMVIKLYAGLIKVPLTKLSGVSVVISSPKSHAWLTTHSAPEDCLHIQRQAFASGQGPGLENGRLNCGVKEQ